MENKFFEELSRRLREGGIESSNVEDKRLEVFLHGRPVLFVSPGHDAFLLPAGSQNQKASELYHRVAEMADEVARIFSLSPAIMMLTHTEFRLKGLAR